MAHIRQGLQYPHDRLQLLVNGLELYRPAVQAGRDRLRAAAQRRAQQGRCFGMRVSGVGASAWGAMRALHASRSGAQPACAAIRSHTRSHMLHTYTPPVAGLPSWRTTHFHTNVRARAHASARVRARARACVCAYVGACMHACICACARVCTRTCVQHARMPRPSYLVDLHPNELPDVDQLHGFLPLRLRDRDQAAGGRRCPRARASAHTHTHTHTVTH